MFNFVDIILLALIVFFVFTGIRKGFTKTLLSFVARIASLITAYFISDTYSEEIYEKFFKDSFINAIELNFGSQLTGDIGDRIHIAWSNLPQPLLSIGDKFGLDKLAFNGELEDVDISGTVSSVIEESVAGPIAISVCKIIVFAIASVGTSFVFSVVVNLLCKVVKLPILKTADKLFGAGLGLVNGVLCVAILAVLIVVVSAFIDSPEFIDAVNSSFVINIFSYTNVIV